MPTTFANAYPRKHFFLEMFTRDISLEDCILDLIDNSIDGLVRSRDVDFTRSILDANGPAAEPPAGPPAKIAVSYSAREFRIQDTCGGIEREHALEDVFNFGHPAGVTGGALGVYGIGLKRAIFKIGNHFEMESRTPTDGFVVDLDVRKWSQQDRKLADWKIPLAFTAGASSGAKAGTKIKISDLRPEVVMRMNDGVLESRLYATISQTYGLFLGRHVDVTLNGKLVEPFSIPIGKSDEVQAAHDEFQQEGVTVSLFASLASPDAKGEWPFEPAGWYALCNGRIVVTADKTDLTGWGPPNGPVWHAGKYRRFVGVAFFQSSDPLALPWTTTKRGLNRESPVYQAARNRMQGIAKPILRFLDNMYKADPIEEPLGRAIAGRVTQTTLAEVAAAPQAPFKVTYPARARPRTTVKVQYDAERADIERINKQLRKPGWSASRVGKYTFDHFLKMECPE